MLTTTGVMTESPPATTAAMLHCFQGNRACVAVYLLCRELAAGPQQHSLTSLSAGVAVFVESVSRLADQRPVLWFGGLLHHCCLVPYHTWPF
jgi:hypothetical protein